MPTQSTTYNSRVTDEALEKRFRDTFRAQGGAELVDDLYAQGVIVPIVDFTQAATGDVLSESLQQAWDFSTGHATLNASSSQIITTSGFWRIGINVATTGAVGNDNARLSLSDGLSTKVIWQLTEFITGSTDALNAINDTIIVYLRANDSITASSSTANTNMDVWYRQIATVNGDLVNPTGFTSS